MAGVALALAGSPGGYHLQELASGVPASAGSYVEYLSPLPASDQCSHFSDEEIRDQRGKGFHPSSTAN